MKYHLCVGALKFCAGGTQALVKRAADEVEETIGANIHLDCILVYKGKLLKILIRVTM